MRKGRAIYRTTRRVCFPARRRSGLAEGPGPAPTEVGVCGEVPGAIPTDITGASPNPATGVEPGEGIDEGGGGATAYCCDPGASGLVFP